MLGTAARETNKTTIDVRVVSDERKERDGRETFCRYEDLKGINVGPGKAGHRAVNPMA